MELFKYCLKADRNDQLTVEAERISDKSSQQSSQQTKFSLFKQLVGKVSDRKIHE